MVDETKKQVWEQYTKSNGSVGERHIGFADGFTLQRDPKTNDVRLMTCGLVLDREKTLSLNPSESQRNQDLKLEMRNLYILLAAVVDQMGGSVMIQTADVESTDPTRLRATKDRDFGFLTLEITE